MPDNALAKIGLRLHVEHFEDSEGVFQMEPFTAKSAQGLWRQFNERFPGLGDTELDKLFDFQATRDAQIFATLDGSVGTTAAAMYNATPANGMAIVMPGQNALATGDKLVCLYVRNTHASQNLLLRVEDGTTNKATIATLTPGKEFFAVMSNDMGNTAGKFFLEGSGASTTFKGFAIFKDIA